jgi:hypothetical protein
VIAKKPDSNESNLLAIGGTKMAKRTILKLLVIFLMFGCAASPQPMNNLQLGMSKTEVIDTMGNPVSTSASQDVEFLKYRFRSDGMFSADYYVKLQNGKVDAFGRAGDFGLGY